VGGGIPTDPKVALCRRLRGDGSRPQGAFAPGLRSHSKADGGDLLDSRTLRSTPESSHRAGYDGAKRKKGSKVHAAVDTFGHLLALHVTPAIEQDRAQVEKLAQAMQEATGESVVLAYVDQGYTGEEASEAVKAKGIRLELVKHPGAKKGFVLLARRWVVERDFAWAARFRRLVKDYERLAATVAGLHFVAFACLFLHRAIAVLSAGP
jgi:transposase